MNIFDKSKCKKHLFETSKVVDKPLNVIYVAIIDIHLCTREIQCYICTPIRIIPCISYCVCAIPNLKLFTKCCIYDEIFV